MSVPPAPSQSGRLQAPPSPSLAPSGVMPAVLLAIPYPPSANRLWRNVGGRTIKSAAYRQWIDAAGWEVRKQRPRGIIGRYHMTLTATAPDKRWRDIGNLEKATSDLLAAVGVVENDRLCRRLVLEWADAIVPGGALTVHLSEVA